MGLATFGNMVSSRICPATEQEASPRNCDEPLQMAKPRCASRRSVSNGDDDLPTCLSRLQVADRVGDLAQRERPIDHRRDLPRFDQLLQEDESVSGVFGAAEGMQFAHEGRNHDQLREATQAPEPPMARPTVGRTR